MLIILWARTIYRINDNYLQFWFCYVLTHKDELKHGLKFLNRSQMSKTHVILFCEYKYHDRKIDIDVYLKLKENRGKDEDLYIVFR